MRLRLTLPFALFLAVFALALLFSSEFAGAQADRPVARNAPPTVSAGLDPSTEPTVVAVGKTMPAVVNISTERIVTHTVRDADDEFFHSFFGGPMRPPRQIRQKEQSLGSGFLVDPSGLIMTNEHVVQRAAELKITVTTNDGKTHPARYVTGSKENDLALLKIDSRDPLPFISPIELSPNLLGQTVLVLGNPLGYGSSVSRGILSAKNRTVSVDDVEYQNLVQTDAAINPGNSGGPLVDLNGRLVGVSSVKMAFTPQGMPTQGLGFAIPGETVRVKLEEFRKAAGKTKSVAGPDELSRAERLFGLRLQDLTRDLSATLGYQADAGVLIADVLPHSPGGEVGMKRGLVIYRVGSYEVASSRQIEDLLGAVDSGSMVDFTVGIVRRTGGRYVREVQTVTLTAR